MSTDVVRSTVRSKLSSCVLGFEQPIGGPSDERDRDSDSVSLGERMGVLGIPMISRTRQLLESVRSTLLDREKQSHCLVLSNFKHAPK